MSDSSAPTRSVLVRAEARAPAFGHPDDDFLSEAHGFLPATPPLTGLPASHAAWDQAAAELPELYRCGRVMRGLEELPLLSANEADLAPGYVSRAALVVGTLAHAYGLETGQFPSPLPEVIERPWLQLNRRMGREVAGLYPNDWLFYNWQLRDPRRADRMHFDNLDMMVQSVGCPTERFWLVFMDWTARAVPLIGLTVRLQEAMLADDPDGVEAALEGVLAVLRKVTFESFFTVDACPHSDYYIDPVITACTVFSFTGSIREGEIGLSGASVPAFSLLDNLLGRQAYGSTYGRHIRRCYDVMPQHQREFIAAAGEVSLRDYVQRVGRGRLEGLLHTVLDAYAGDRGFFGLHLLKLYAYMEMGIRSGRTGTNVGFEGTARDRAWERLGDDVDEARMERYVGLPSRVHYARVREVADTSGSADSGVKRVVLDIADTGIRYQAGDRCGILPRNSDALVERTLRALGAQGHERVPLDRAWTRHLQSLGPDEPPETLPLRAFLRDAKIRPVLRSTAKLLQRLSGAADIRAIVESRTEDQYELWDLLERAGRGRFDARRLWRAAAWEEESLARLVPPERFRLYSISSAPDDRDRGAPSEIHLTVGGLVYQTEDLEGHVRTRHGAASNYLVDHLGPGGEPVAVQIFRPSRFALPTDPARPVVMFAAGTGISPFRGFLEERARTEGCGDNWLIYGTRTPQAVHYQEELSQLVRAHKLHCRVAFSQADQRLRSVPGQGLLIEFAARGYIDRLFDEPDDARTLWQLIAPRALGGQEAAFYVCGQTRFAHTVHQLLKRTIGQFHPEGADAAAGLFYRMVANKRLMHDIFTTFAPAMAPGVLGDGTYDISEIVMRNQDGQGYWFVVDGNVYDMTEFRELHPGGDKLIVAYAGADATRAYKKVQHHLNPEVHAMLDMYKIGKVRRLDFARAWGIALTAEGATYVPLAEAFRMWVRYLYRIVEMENALTNEHCLWELPLTASDRPPEFNQRRANLVLEAHERFQAVYLNDLTREPLRDLWRVTVGLFAHERSISTFDDTVVAVRGQPRVDEGLRATVTARELVDGLAFPPAPTDAARWHALGDALAAFERADRWVASELKKAIAHGLQAFERWQEQTIERGGPHLIAAIERIPTIMSEYYGSLARAFSGLADPAGGGVE